jgi:cyclic beta-1,2-glucan synthetase
MGFFLWSVLDAFTPFCEARGDTKRLRRFAAYREGLRHALETAGWDGEWYRRGYYDDGTPLGSHANDECRIDALVQAWAVLSGAARPERARAALDAVLAQLVSEHEGLIRLLAPPFVDTPHDPGYIKGYVAGVRENGGQYTHAALWVVRALAELGRNDRVAPLLEMLTPLHHTRTPADVARYRVEPYVVAADVYGAPPHVGRGGWTWYTGSSGWMYRVVVESLLGFAVEHGRTIVLSPCVPDDWDGFELCWRVPGTATSYAIAARNPRRRGLGVESATLDGQPMPVEDGAARVPLVRDGAAHRVELVLGGAA